MEHGSGTTQYVCRHFDEVAEKTTQQFFTTYALNKGLRKMDTYKPSLIHVRLFPFTWDFPWEKKMMATAFTRSIQWGRPSTDVTGTVVINTLNFSARVKPNSIKHLLWHQHTTFKMTQCVSISVESYSLDISRL